MRRIVFDCERMKYRDTGLYHFCKNLSAALNTKMNTDREELIRYIPRHIDCGGSRINQYFFQKFLFPNIQSADIWHVTFHHSNYFPSQTTGLKIVLTIHDLNFLYKTNLQESKKAKYIHNLQTRIDRADALVCVSEYCKKDLLEHCQTDGKLISVIYNGTNPLVAAAITEVPFKPGKPFLFCIGVLQRSKNLTCLIEWMRYLPDLQLVIAGKNGEPEYTQELKHTIHKCGVADRVVITGAITEAAKSWYFHHCQAFVFPSLAEGFGLPVLEAMSAGKPVFLSSATALPEIGGELAYYFDNFEAQHMQEVFIKGMQDFEQNNKAEKLKDRSSAFSWDKAAAQYLSLYHSLYQEIAL